MPSSDVYLRIEGIGCVEVRNKKDCVLYPAYVND